MKRFWIGVCLLVLLLGIGIFTQIGMHRIHDPISRSLDAAAQAALAGDFSQAQALARDAQEIWTRNWHRTAAAADHEPMDRMDTLFAALQVYARQRDTDCFAATCVQLARLARAMGDAHAFNWWNLL